MKTKQQTKQPTFKKIFCLARQKKLDGTEGVNQCKECKNKDC